MIELLPAVQEGSFWTKVIEEESEQIKALPEPLVELEATNIPQYLDFSLEWFEMLREKHDSYTAAIQMMSFDAKVISVLRKQHVIVVDHLKIMYASLQFLRSIKGATADCNPRLQQSLNGTAMRSRDCKRSHQCAGVNGMFLRFAKLNLFFEG